MKKLLAATAAACLAAPALGEVSVNVTPLTGTMGSYSTYGNAGGYSWSPADGLGGPAGGTHVYDNLFSTLGGSQNFFDWVGTGAGWADDLNLGSAQQVNHLHYIYFQNSLEMTAGGATVAGTPDTHTINLYNAPGPAPVTTATILTVLGSNVFNMVLPSMPSGSAPFLVTVSFPTITVGPNSWISLYDDSVAGPSGSGNTFWGTGTQPGIGSSGGGLVYHNYVNFAPPSDGYGLYVPFGGFLDPPTSTIAANIQTALGIPGPASIAVLGAAGLVSLRRRRRK